MLLPSIAPRRNRPRSTAPMLGAMLLIGAYGASAFCSLQRAHDQALQDAGAALAVMARSAESGTARSLFEVDAMLTGIERIVDQVLPKAALDSPALHTVLGQFNAQSLAVGDILILDAAGTVVNRTDATAGRP